MNTETKQERKRLLKELGTLGDMIRGTLVHTGRKCGRKGCHEERYRQYPKFLIRS